MYILYNSIFFSIFLFKIVKNYFISINLLYYQKILIFELKGILIKYLYKRND